MHWNYGNLVAKERIYSSWMDVWKNWMLCTNLAWSWFWCSISWNYSDFYLINGWNWTSYPKYYCCKILAWRTWTYFKLCFSFCSTYFKRKKTWSTSVYFKNQRLKLVMPSRNRFWWHWPKNGFPSQIKWIFDNKSC